MLRAFAKSVLVSALQKKAGVPRTGTIPGTLLTTGASLLLVRGRRPVGLALTAVGCLLLWREIERDRAVTLAAGPALPPPASGDASAATAPR